MKTIVTFLGLIAFAASVSGQAPTDAISRPANQAAVDAATNQLALGDLTFTNRAGTAFSADQLAGQLRELRGAIDQTLPVLIAFNESYSNSPSLGGALSGIVSGVLNRNKTTTTSESGSSSSVSNLVAGLQRLLTTNSTASTSVSANTVRDLETLQAQLQELDGTLRNLNVATVSTNQRGREVLTPTGR